MAPPRILVLNGPNLNLLGTRQPEIYGSDTLADVERRCRDRAKAHGLGARCVQSNAEHVLIETIHAARDGAVGARAAGEGAASAGSVGEGAADDGPTGGGAAAIVINAGAYTHTSIAILDALSAFEGPVVEVHISDIHRREPFRHHSFVALRADHAVIGRGTAGYEEAIDWIAARLGGGI